MKMYESYLTTAQFQNLGKKGFQRHCGPTAITNLIETLSPEKASVNRGPHPAAAKRFMKVAALGRKHLMYINASVLGIYGGTLDMVTPAYIRRCLHMFGMDRIRVGRRHFLTSKRLRQALKRGSIVYLELRHHPKYGNHHVICYGFEKNREKKTFLYRIADGWQSAPVLLTGKELHFGYMIEISGF